MSEADLLSEFHFRTEMMWTILQWWISISFAMMVAAYFGANRLTKSIITIFFGMYALVTFNVVNSLNNHGVSIVDTYETLRLLSESTQLSPIGIGVLERQPSNPGLSRAVFMTVAFLFTCGFVVYSYKFIRKPN